jgi:hypothetical protein
MNSRQDMQVKLPSLPPPKGHSAYRLMLSPLRPIVIPQLADVRDRINQSLDVIDVTAWTGDPKDANFISGQLRLLSENIVEARQALKGPDPDTRPNWWSEPLNPDVSVVFNSTLLMLPEANVAPF